MLKRKGRFKYVKYREELFGITIVSRDHCNTHRNAKRVLLLDLIAIYTVRILIQLKIFVSTSDNNQFLFHTSKFYVCAKQFKISFGNIVI